MRLRYRLDLGIRRPSRHVFYSLVVCILELRHLRGRHMVYARRGDLWRRRDLDMSLLGLLGLLLIWRVWMDVILVLILVLYAMYLPHLGAHVLEHLAPLCLPLLLSPI